MIVQKGIGNPLLTFFTQRYTLTDFKRSLQWDEIKTTSYLTSIMEGYRSAPMTDYTLGYVFLNDQRIIDGCHRVTILFYLLQHLYQVATQHQWGWADQIAPLIVNHEEPYHQYLRENSSRRLQYHSPRQDTFPLVSATVNSPTPDLETVIAKIINDQLIESDYPSFAHWLLHHGILTVV